MAACAWGLQAQTRTIHGTVLDASNDEPLVGATIAPIGGGQGTVADVDGKFTLTVPSNVTKATISYVGYGTETVTLTDGMTVKLASTDTQLEEVVVTALGISRSEKTLGYSATQVSSEDIVSAQNSNVMQSLSGKVAGLKIQTTSSAPGSGTNVTIRGLGSVQGSNQPLYVIDGIPTASPISFLFCLSLIKDNKL